MTELSDIFDRLGLLQYLESFINEGFDTWEVVLYATESDLEALGLKLGHRRKLQKEIAEARGVSIEQVIGSATRNVATDDIPQIDTDAGSIASHGDKTAAGPFKRKYRRHPKTDTSAPERAPSAYVIFSNKIRAELKPQKLNFTDIAKIVGERWQVLEPEEKEQYESQAAAAKDRYNAALVKYKRTSQYRKYQQYLADFKARNTSQAAPETKRPKLETEISGTSSSGGSAILPFNDTDLRRTDSSASQSAFSPGPSLVTSPGVVSQNIPAQSRDSSIGSSLPATPVNSRFPPASSLHTEPSQRNYDIPPPSLPRILPLDNRDNRPHISSLIIDTSSSVNPRRSPAATLPTAIPPAAFIRHDTSKSSITSNISRDSTVASVYTPNTPSEETRSIRSLPPLTLSHHNSTDGANPNEGDRRLLSNLPSRFVADAPQGT
ncbi:MAG: hypothetical protein GOMPHAMPRED_001068 [Gomphillus americanus]|uniref:HMG box domain-containing protein n=1 Tax=Gomphillus americanus TaxID=1940652 RepID=A0A8H3F1V2_9LECA|nr:MAG: hypothetical protein GOMPHAMPRED_001068 [Gomphillus americanus]